jgi:hypothetical protein
MHARDYFQGDSGKFAFRLKFKQPKTALVDVLVYSGLKNILYN